MHDEVPTLAIAASLPGLTLAHTLKRYDKDDPIAGDEPSEIVVDDVEPPEPTPLSRQQRRYLERQAAKRRRHLELPAARRDNKRRSMF